MAWGFSPEEIQAWVNAANTTPTPVVVKAPQLRCETCKRFMGPLETRLEHAGMTVHMTERCLPKFAEKYMKNLNLTKTVSLMEGI